MRQILFVALAIVLAGVVPDSLGQSPDPIATATDPAAERVVRSIAASGAIIVDGRLDEAVWREAPPTTALRQRDPIEGADPTEPSEVFVVYDDEAIYVGARLFDSAPDSIVARLGRRDSFVPSDRFIVFFDPYHDGRSGYYFGINAGGTIDDGVLLNDSWDDSAWDGVWQGRATIDQSGWTVEMRIPYSQLRFYQQDEYVWGINFRRDISRKQERDYLVYQPRGESGFVSRFWRLTGVRGIRPQRQVEIVPYVTSQAGYDQTVQDNPFNDGSEYGVDAGLDVRVGITPNLSLNGTINPDFGQVEVDPAVINLSDFETFYPEKRPFFIEGSTTFDNFGYGGSNDNWGFNWSNPTFFYSRRIGRPPQGQLPDHDHVDLPDGARILGAAKVTGKLGGDWNVGTVHALTARESAELAIQDVQSRLEVEPATYYGVYRAQKELRDARHGIGVLSTLTNRFFAADHLRDDVNARAFVFGLDGWTTLDSTRTWVMHGWGGLSRVTGSEQRLLDLQQSSLHYFQRPDAGHVSLDSTATSLTGLAGRIAVNKQQGRMLFNSAIGTVSPGFDASDLGFQSRADVVNGHIAGGYRWPDPGRLTRTFMLLGALFGSVDYGGNRIWSGVWSRVYAEFLNYYAVNVYVAANPSSVNNRRTRGGPLTLTRPGYEVGFFANTDRRQRFVVSADGSTYQSESFRYLNFSTEVEWKPADNVSISVSPAISWDYENAQWVEAFDDPLATETFGRRYVLAELDQRTISASVRLNWTFTPTLTFQLYAQPLVSRGDYYAYKWLARPRSDAYVRFGEGASTIDEETLVADPDGPGPALPLELPRLDFNVTSLRGTAVLRWEYRPGSTLYLVWTQRRSESVEDPMVGFSRSMDQLWSAPMENIFLIKLTYWLGR